MTILIPDTAISILFSRCVLRPYTTKLRLQEQRQIYTHEILSLRQPFLGMHKILINKTYAEVLFFASFQIRLIIYGCPKRESASRNLLVLYEYTDTE